MGDGGSDNQINYKELSYVSSSEISSIENFFSNIKLVLKKTAAKPA